MIIFLTQLAWLLRDTNHFMKIKLKVKTNYFTKMYPLLLTLGDKVKKHTFETFILQKQK